MSYDSNDPPNGPADGMDLNSFVQRNTANMPVAISYEYISWSMQGGHVL